MKTICIYILKWVDSGNFYIGQTINAKTRFKCHENEMKIGKHKNVRVQRCYNKYGLPIFEILEECKYEELNSREQYYLDIYFNNNKCCNLNSNAYSTKGHKYSEEALKSIREKRKNRVYPKGENAYAYGRHHTEEAKIKLSESRKGKKFPNLSKALKGRIISEEWRKKVSEGCRLGNAPKAKIVLDTQTGVFYSCAKEVCDLYGFHAGTFRDKLRGEIKNKTQFIYA